MGMRSLSSRTAVVAVAMGLVSVGCAMGGADQGSSDPATDVALAVDPAATATAPAASAPADVSDAAPARTDTRDTALDATPVPLAVSWLDTELTLPAPWQFVSSEGPRLILRHPSAAGRGQGVSVTLEARGETAPPTQAIGEELPALFSSGGPGLRLTLAGSVLLISDTGIQIHVVPDDAHLAVDEASRASEASLEIVLELLATIKPPPPPPSTTPDRPAASERPTPSNPRLPLIQTRFGPPFPQDLPVPMIAGVTLAAVEDIQAALNRKCYTAEGEVDCTDFAARCVARPEWMSASDCEAMLAARDAELVTEATQPRRVWTYRMPSGSDTDIRAVCASYHAGLVGAGATFERYPGESCEIDVAHGYRMAYVGGTLPDGSRLDGRVRDHDSALQNKGLCGRPCPTIVVEIRFP